MEYLKAVLGIWYLSPRFRAISSCEYFDIAYWLGGEEYVSGVHCHSNFSPLSSQKSHFPCSSCSLVRLLGKYNSPDLDLYIPSPFTNCEEAVIIFFSFKFSSTAIS